MGNLVELSMIIDWAVQSNVEIFDHEELLDFYTQ